MIRVIQHSVISVLACIAASESPVLASSEAQLEYAAGVLDFQKGQYRSAATLRDK